MRTSYQQHTQSMSKQVEDRICALLSEHLALEPSLLIKPQTKLLDLGADSLDLLDILMVINETFHIQIPAENLPSIHTVQNLIDHVLQKLINK